MRELLLFLIWFLFEILQFVWFVILLCRVLDRTLLVYRTHATYIICLCMLSWSFTCVFGDECLFKFHSYSFCALHQDVCGMEELPHEPNRLCICIQMQILNNAQI